MAQGAILNINFFACAGTGLWDLAKLPLLIQYAGRWGLHLRLQYLFGDLAKADRFEVRKQYVEPAAWGLSYLAVVAVGLDAPW